MTQPSTNCVQVHPCPQHVSCCGVAQRVCADPLRAEGRDLVGSGPRTALDQLPHPRACDRSPTPISKHSLPCGAPGNQGFQCFCRALQQWALSRLPAFPAKSDERPPDTLAGQLHVPDSELNRFGNPSTRVVQEQQDGVFATALMSCGVRDGQQGVDFVFFEVANGWRGSLFPWDSGDLAAPFDLFGAAGGDIAGECPGLEYLRSFGLFGLWQLWQSSGPGGRVHFMIAEKSSDVKVQRVSGLAESKSRCCISHDFGGFYQIIPCIRPAVVRIKGAHGCPATIRIFILGRAVQAWQREPGGRLMPPAMEAKWARSTIRERGNRGQSLSPLRLSGEWVGWG